MTDLFGKIDSVVDAEVASEILNKARGRLTDRIYEIQASHPEEAARLKDLRGTLFQRQQRINYRQSGEIADIIQEWGPLLKDEDAFWRHVNG